MASGSSPSVGFGLSGKLLVSFSPPMIWMQVSWSCFLIHGSFYKLRLFRRKEEEPTYVTNQLSVDCCLGTVVAEVPWMCAESKANENKSVWRQHCPAEPQAKFVEHRWTGSIEDEVRSRRNNS